MANASISVCQDPNFAVICSFIEKYGELVGLHELSIAKLQNYLEDQKEVKSILIDIHIKLLKKIGKKCVSHDRWEKSLVKFCHKFSEVDAWEMEKFGYKNSKLSTKLMVLKTLCECQFDDNIKFKNEVNKFEAEEMRVLPIGRDSTGIMYWFQLDKDLNVRVYREEQDDEDHASWELICSDREQLASLINTLSASIEKPKETSAEGTEVDAKEKDEAKSTQETKEEEKKSESSALENNSILEKSANSDQNPLLESQSNEVCLEDKLKSKEEQIKTNSVDIEECQQEIPQTLLENKIEINGKENGSCTPSPKTEESKDLENGLILTVDEEKITKSKNSDQKLQPAKNLEINNIKKDSNSEVKCSSNSLCKENDLSVILKANTLHNELHDCKSVDKTNFSDSDETNKCTLVDEKKEMPSKDIKNINAEMLESSSDKPLQKECEKSQPIKDEFKSDVKSEVNSEKDSQETKVKKENKILNVKPDSIKVEIKKTNDEEMEATKIDNSEVFETKIKEEAELENDKKLDLKHVKQINMVTKNLKSMKKEAAEKQESKKDIEEKVDPIDIDNNKVAKTDTDQNEDCKLEIKEDVADDHSQIDKEELSIINEKVVDEHITNSKESDKIQEDLNEEAHKPESPKIITRQSVRRVTRASLTDFEQKIENTIISRPKRGNQFVKPCPPPRIAKQCSPQSVKQCPPQTVKNCPPQPVSRYRPPSVKQCPPMEDKNDKESKIEEIIEPELGLKRSPRLRGRQIKLVDNENELSENSKYKEISKPPPKKLFQKNDSASSALPARATRSRSQFREPSPEPLSSEESEDTIEDNSDSEYVPRVKRARTSRPTIEENAGERHRPVIVDDKPCSKCLKYNLPEWILLCDKCDSGYHTACLRPPLMYIPDGDWFCPPCEHKLLCEKLSEELKNLDGHLKKKERLEKRRERLAYVGISLDNVLKPDKKENFGGSNIEEDLYMRRSCRARKDISYKFKEFDELIDSAIQEDMEEERGAGMGKGKDMSNIIGEPKPVVLQKRKHRRLNDLDTDSEGTNEETDDEYKGTSESASEVDVVPEEVSENSDDSYRRSYGRSYGRRRAPRRGKRSRRRRRSDDEFIDEYDSDYSDYYRRSQRKASKHVSYREDSNTDSEYMSDEPAWRRPQRVSSYRSVTHKRRSNYSDSDDSVDERKKRKRHHRGSSEEDNTNSSRRSRRTRAKRVNYKTLLLSESENEEEFQKKKLRLKDFIKSGQDEEEENKKELEENKKEEDKHKLEEEDVKEAKVDKIEEIDEEEEYEEDTDEEDEETILKKTMKLLEGDDDYDEEYDDEEEEEDEEEEKNKKDEEREEKLKEAFDKQKLKKDAMSHYDFEDSNSDENEFPKSLFEAKTVENRGMKKTEAQSIKVQPTVITKTNEAESNIKLNKTICPEILKSQNFEKNNTVTLKEQMPINVLKSENLPTAVTKLEIEEKKLEEKIPVNFLKSEKIPLNLLKSEKISTNMLKSEKIATNMLKSEKIPTNMLKSEKSSSNLLQTEKISTHILKPEKIPITVLQSEKLPASELTSEKISTNILTSEKLPIVLKPERMHSGVFKSEKMPINVLKSENLPTVVSKLENISATALKHESISTNILKSENISTDLLKTENTLTNVSKSENLSENVSTNVTKYENVSTKLLISEKIAEELKPEKKCIIKPEGKFVYDSPRSYMKSISKDKISSNQGFSNTKEVIKSVIKSKLAAAEEATKKEHEKFSFLSMEKTKQEEATTNIKKMEKMVAMVEEPFKNEFPFMPKKEEIRKIIDREQPIDLKKEILPMKEGKPSLVQDKGTFQKSFQQIGHEPVIIKKDVKAIIRPQEPIIAKFEREMYRDEEIPLVEGVQDLSMKSARLAENKYDVKLLKSPKSEETPSIIESRLMENRPPVIRATPSLHDRSGQDYPSHSISPIHVRAQSSPKADYPSPTTGSYPSSHSPYSYHSSFFQQAYPAHSQGQPYPSSIQGQGYPPYSQYGTYPGPGYGYPGSPQGHPYPEHSSYGHPYGYYGPPGQHPHNGGFMIDNLLRGSNKTIPTTAVSPGEGRPASTESNGRITPAVGTSTTGGSASVSGGIGGGNSSSNSGSGGATAVTNSGAGGEEDDLSGVTDIISYLTQE